MSTNFQVGGVGRAVRLCLCAAAWLVASATWADGAAGGGRLMADWPKRLTEAGCPELPGKKGERRCTTRDSFAVCKEAVDAGHLKRCHLADPAGAANSAHSRETYPAKR